MLRLNDLGLYIIIVAWPICSVLTLTLKIKQSVRQFAGHTCASMRISDIFMVQLSFLLYEGKEKRCEMLKYI